MKRYTAAVIGLGNIGMLYDYHLNPQTHLFTHSAAYQHHEGFELIGAVELDKAKQDKFQEKFNKQAFTTLHELLANAHPDVVSICTPFDQQASVFFELVDSYIPKAIMFEKPLTGDIAVSQEIVKALEQHNIVSVVNYIRRFEPGAKKMSQMLRMGEIGQLKKIVGWYSKDITSNACHIIDLVTSVLPEQEFDFIEVNEQKAEIILHCKELQLHLFVSPHSYRRFEIEFVGTKGIMHYLNSGKEISVKKIITDSAINSIYVLDDKGEVLPNDIGRYQWYSVDALYQNLRQGTKIESTAQTALFTEEVISKIKSLANRSIS